MRTITAVAIAVVVAACAPVAPPLSVTLRGDTPGQIVVTILDGGRYVTAIRPARPDRMPLSSTLATPTAISGSCASPGSPDPAGRPRRSS
jgi:hypothetical protein